MRGGPLVLGIPPGAGAQFFRASQNRHRGLLTLHLRAPLPDSHPGHRPEDAPPKSDRGVCVSASAPPPAWGSSVSAGLLVAGVVGTQPLLVQRQAGTRLRAEDPGGVSLSLSRPQPVSATPIRNVERALSPPPLSRHPTQRPPWGLTRLRDPDAQITEDERRGGCHHGPARGASSKPNRCLLLGTRHGRPRPTDTAAPSEGAGRRRNPQSRRQRGR